MDLVAVPEFWSVIYSVQCPKCHAGEGRLCTDEQWKSIDGYVHAERVQADQAC